MILRYGLIALCVLFAACEKETEVPAADVAASEPTAEALYQDNCGSCHNGATYKAPHRMFLAMMAPDAILASMDGGLMAEQANALSERQRKAIAEHIAGRGLDAEIVQAASASL